MKNRIRSILAAGLASVLVVSLCASCSADSGKTPLGSYVKEGAAYRALQGKGDKTPDPAEVGEKKKAQENEYLILYYDEKTAETAVFDKRTGAWWHSNPADRQGAPAAAASQLSVSTINSQGVVQQYTSYVDSVSKGQVSFTVKDGLTVEYTFGNIKPDLSMVPLKLTNERLEELEQRAEDAGAQSSLFKRRYSRQGDIWTRRDGLTADQAKKLRELFEEIGYTAEELEQDNAATGAAAAVEESSGFTIPLQYTLDGDSLRVCVPGDGIQYPSNELITSLNVLEYFGALKEGADGYLFIPDGSGAIVDTTALKGSTGLYTAPVYGTDFTLFQETQNNKKYDILLPVFGISRPDAGVLTIIEDNEAAASVRAFKPGYVDSFAAVSAAFELNPTENIGLSGDDISKFYVTTETVYEGDCALRYVFLDKENADYSGMARIYRAYLQLDGAREPLSDTGDIPFFLETIGAVETEISTLGFVHETYAPLTTYEDNIALIEELSSKGVRNIQLILSGWMNGGTDQKLADRIDLISVLGGKKGFEKLMTYTQENQIGFYPQVLLNSFSNRNSQSVKNKYTSQTLAGEKSELTAYDLPSGIYIPGETPGQRYILSPAWQMTIGKAFLAAMGKINLNSIALGDIAHTVYSDYNEKSEALRQNSVLQSRDIVKLYADGLSDLMLFSPNHFNAGYSTVYTDVPKSSSSYSVSAGSVPFYQMVYHGYADYSFTPINFDSDFRKSVLKCAEYGGYPKFRFTYREDDRLNIAEFSELYATPYTRWLDDAAQAYTMLNELLRPVRGAVMTGHAQLAPGVYRTDYDNGMQIYVNYTDKAVTVDGVTVGALDAVRKEAAGQ